MSFGKHIVHGNFNVGKQNIAKFFFNLILQISFPSGLELFCPKLCSQIIDSILGGGNISFVTIL